ncbi:MAG: hypothetical protein WBV94_25125 [Blastocatellia bacterium]
MPQKIDKEFAAQVLIEAVYTTDEKVCTKYGISTKTLQRYRKLASTDVEMSNNVRTKKEAFDKAWADEIPVALRKALRFIGRACDEADPRNPAVIEKMVGAIKIIAEAEMTGKFIDARIGNTNRAEGELSRPDDSPPALVN